MDGYSPSPSQTNSSGLLFNGSDCSRSSQIPTVGPLVMKTVSSQRLPVGLLRPGQPHHSLSSDEENFLVVDSFVWDVDMVGRGKVYGWVKSLNYHRFWCWKQRRGFKKLVKSMRKLGSQQQNGHINNTFNVALAHLDILNIRVLSQERRVFQFFVLSDNRIHTDRVIHSSHSAHAHSPPILPIRPETPPHHLTVRPQAHPSSSPHSGKAPSLQGSEVSSNGDTYLMNDAAPLMSGGRG